VVAEHSVSRLTMIRAMVDDAAPGAPPPDPPPDDGSEAPPAPGPRPTGGRYQSIPVTVEE
ncbi:MAG: hypothetical protein ACSLE6_09370, partial [Mycobacterium sp.]